MTIDEAINHYEDMKKGLYLVYPEPLFDFTIDILRKYQKIEQIYKEWFSDAGHTSAEAYERIGEVIEDGNDD